MREEGIDMARVAVAVKEKRKEQGLSQQALGEKFNMSGGYIGWIEAGKADKLDEGKVKNILSFLGLSLSGFKSGGAKEKKAAGKTGAKDKTEKPKAAVGMIVKKAAAPPVKKPAAKEEVTAEVKPAATPPVQPSVTRVEKPAPSPAPAPAKSSVEEKKAPPAHPSPAAGAAPQARQAPVPASPAPAQAIPGTQPQGSKPVQKSWDYTGRAGRRFYEWARYRIPIEIKLDNGEMFAGHLMWHDQYAVKLLTNEGKEMVIMKHSIVYIIDTPRSDERPAAPEGAEKER